MAIIKSLSHRIRSDFSPSRRVNNLRYKIFHALANEGNASKVFVARAMINREDADFTMLLVNHLTPGERYINDGINSSPFSRVQTLTYQATRAGVT